MDPQLWAAAIEAPLVALLAWMLHTLRRDLTGPDRTAERGDSPRGGPTADDAGARAREELAEFKLEVARTYVPLSLIRDVDARLSRQLLRIEEKLDEVSRVAAATTAAVAHHRMQRPPIGFGPRAAAHGEDMP